jgi:hypothetical protein
MIYKTYIPNFLVTLLKSAQPKSSLKNDRASLNRDWRRDPLSHPDIQAMSERERSDLPFDPRDTLPD